MPEILGVFGGRRGQNVFRGTVLFRHLAKGFGDVFGLGPPGLQQDLKGERVERYFLAESDVEVRIDLLPGLRVAGPEVSEQGFFKGGEVFGRQFLGRRRGQLKRHENSSIDVPGATPIGSPQV